MTSKATLNGGTDILFDEDHHDLKPLGKRLQCIVPWLHPRGAADGLDGMAHRLVRLEPLDAVLGSGHVLADRDWLRPADLAASTLVLPAAAQRLDYLARFADRFDIVSRSEGPNLGLTEFLERIRTGRDCFSLLPESFGAAGRASRWLEFRPGADRLPDPDLAQAERITASGRPSTL
jgi:hypothetical protein